MKYMSKMHFAFKNTYMCLKESDLFKNVNGRRHYSPNAMLCIIVFFCLWGGSLALGRFMAVPFIESLPKGAALWDSIALSMRKVLICGIQILVFFTWVRLAEKRKIMTMGFICKEKAKQYWGGFLLGFGSITLILFILAVLGAIKVHFNNLFPTEILICSLCIAVFGWAIQSASEEIAIRGWLIPALGRRCNPLAAVLLTGGVFGIIHLMGDGATVLSLINLTLSGYFFALYAISAGNIWGVCGLHFGWNLAQGNVYGLNVSGEQSVNSSLLTTNIIGDNFLTGGDFGPEGSLITTLFLACAIVLINLKMYRKHLMLIGGKV